MKTPQPTEHNPEFEALLTYIKRSRGFDFTGYKRASLMRRIQKRLQTLNLETYTDYVDHLQVHPEEYARLFDTILINVTGFFRDPTAWDYIASEVIPRILREKPENEPIRVWSAGCASGEEAYTIAMLLAEALGVDHYRERVKIYASDVDEQALTHARQASYGAREVEAIPPDLLERYFDRSDHRRVFRKDLRRSVIFGRHDLVQDAPISRIDLLICRNVLMYFNSEMQGRILSRFHFALNEKSYLFLGKAEMLFTHANLFVPVDLKRRVFSKVRRTSMRDRLLSMAGTNLEAMNDDPPKHIRFREAAFDTNPIAQIVVDLNGYVALTNERARSLPNLAPGDVHRALQELEVSYRIPELRLRIEEAYADRRPTMLKEVGWTTSSGDQRTLEIQVTPLLDNGTVLGTSVLFTDITRYQLLQQEVEHSNQELEAAYEELQSTNEELETTNEELQSTVEELETTNEELQSTNEELETINEELQSTNEELQTINEELRRRTDELNDVNAFMESILRSMRGSVVVVDRELRVQVWNGKSEDLWGLRSSEVRHKNFLNLDFGLPVEQLRASLRACLTQEFAFADMTVEAVNRRGKSITCKVTCSPLFDGSGDQITGIILLMEDEENSR